MAVAFAVKLWFKFRDNKSLWSAFMHAKYCRDKFPGACAPKLTDSPIWKRMFVVSVVAQENIIWQVNSGNLHFWHDHWVLNTASPEDLQAIVPNRLVDHSLLASWLEADNWNMEKLRSISTANLHDHCRSSC